MQLISDVVFVLCVCFNFVGVYIFCGFSDFVDFEF